MPELAVIANPISGRGRGRAVGEEVLRRLAERGVRAELLITEQPGDGTRAAIQVLKDGCRRIVACGGDGTVHEVAAALVPAGGVLGIVPSGRGNDIARVLGIPDDVAGAVAVIAGGIERRIDVGRIGNRTFLTVASLGFDAEVAARARRSALRLPGALNYVGAVLATVATYRSLEVELEGDGHFGRFTGPVLMVATANMSTYGGGMRIAPAAICDDGLFDVCIVRELPRRTLLRLFPRVFSGTHVSLPFVEMRRTRRLRIRTSRPAQLYADGEPMGETPATIEVAERALAVLSPGGR